MGKCYVEKPRSVRSKSGVLLVLVPGDQRLRRALAQRLAVQPGHAGSTGADQQCLTVGVPLNGEILAVVGSHPLGSLQPGSTLLEFADEYLTATFPLDSQKMFAVLGWHLR